MTNESTRRSRVRRPGRPAAPALTLLALEPVRAVADYCVSLLGSEPAECGDGHPVLVLPGLAAGDWSTSRLRRAIAGAGFEAHAWGLGINRGPRGDFDRWLGGLERRVHELDRASGGRGVSLVGWSLGGIYARELARRAPQRVRHVVTLATPFAGLDANHATGLYRLLNGGAGELTPALERRLREDPPVPSTAIYSRSDGVVAWQACMSQGSRWCENIEVGGVSHCGMAAHPAVLRIVVDRLAQARKRPARSATATNRRAGRDMRVHAPG